MKKFILLWALVTPLVLSAQEIKSEKVRFEVSGNCEMCKKRIEKAALTVKGIKSASWDIPSNIISIIRDPRKSSLNDVQKAISLAGHDTPLSKAPDKVYNDLPMCCLYERVIE